MIIATKKKFIKIFIKIFIKKNSSNQIPKKSQISTKNPKLFRKLLGWSKETHGWPMQAQEILGTPMGDRGQGCLTRPGCPCKPRVSKVCQSNPRTPKTAANN